MNARVLFLTAILLSVTLLAGCGGGGGTADLITGVNLSGGWTVTTTVTQASGACGQQVGEVDSTGLEIQHDRAARTIVIDPGTSEAMNGTMNGVVARFAGTRQDGGNSTTTFDITLTFSSDGARFTGKVTFTSTDPTGTCTTTLDVVGFNTFTPPLRVQSIEPPDGADGVAYDAPVVVTFSRIVDPASVVADSLVLHGPNGMVAGQIAIAGNTVTLQPAALLDIGSTYEIHVADVRAADGGLLTGDVGSGFATPLVHEDFRFTLELRGSGTFLGTNATGEGRVAFLPGGTPAPGQLWRFSEIGAFHLMRNDQFVNAQALEGSDGSIPCLMTGYGASPFTGQRFETVPDGGGIVLKTLFQGPDRAMTALPFSGEIAPFMLDLQPGRQNQVWVLSPIERIVPAFPLAPIGTDQTIDRTLTFTDPQGLFGAPRRCNLYLLEVTEDVLLTITQRSSGPAAGGIDSLLVLLTDDCLNDPDLAQWTERCLLALDDDGGGGDPEALSVLDSRISDFPLSAGRYVIAASSLDVEDGPYRLRTSAVVPRLGTPITVLPVRLADLPLRKR